MKRLFLTLILIPALLFARGTSGGMGTFGPALALIDFTSVNRSLRAASFDEISSRHWMFGGGGYLIANRTMIGGAGWGGTQTSTSESLNVVCRVEYGGGEFRAGYIVLDTRYLLITPGIGIGGGGYTIHLEPYNQSIPNFDTLLRNPGRTSTISFSGFCLNPQLAITIPISFIGIDIRGGYNLGPFTAKWAFADHGFLSRGPEMGKGTPWVSLNVLFGGFNREKTRTIKGKIEFKGDEGEEKEPEKEQEPQKEE